jgi:hypothetical protein
MEDLMPINICSVVYNLVSGIGTPSQAFLPDSVAANQISAFIPDMLITNNILLAYKCTLFMKNKRTKKNGLTAVNPKAYDRVCGIFGKN